MAERIFSERKRVEFCYRPSPPELAGAASTGEAQELFAEALARSLSSEMRARRSLLGPQRDDLEITLDGRPASKYASAGEQRRIAFTLVMTALERALDEGVASNVMLLDDVEAEFDDERLDRVIEFVSCNAQAFVATAKEGVVKRYENLGSVLSVSQGEFRHG